MRGESFVHIADAADDEAYRLGNPVRRALVDIAGARSYLAVPIAKDGILLGSFTIYRREVRPFEADVIALLQNFATQAAIAIENARLFNETREALERQTATADILKVIASSPSDVQPVFDAIAASANRLIGRHLEPWSIGLSTAWFISQPSRRKAGCRRKRCRLSFPTTDSPAVPHLAIGASRRGRAKSPIPKPIGYPRHEANLRGRAASEACCSCR